MKTKQDLLNQMAELNACEDATSWVRKQELETAQAIWDACESPSWMIWYAARCGIEHKTLVRLAAAFARSVLFLAPENEQRPRVCVETVEAWCEGRATIENVRVAADAATDAATDAVYAAADAAYAATYAATYAADAAYVAAYAAAYAADAADAAYAAYAHAATYAAAAGARVETRRQVQLELIRKAIPACPRKGEER
jgi:hypothetical protein